MSKFTGVVESTLNHCYYVADHMRQADRNELRACSGRTPTEVLIEGYESSSPCYTAMIDGEPAAMFGIVPYPGDSRPRFGSIWLLGTDKIDQCPMAFLRRCPSVLYEITKGYHYLSNSCHADNKLHIKWLRWLGFDVEPTPYLAGRYGEPFYFFSKSTPKE